jgi:hypothetical protein
VEVASSAPATFDPAGDVAEIALLKENNVDLWARVRELEAQVPPQAQ